MLAANEDPESPVEFTDSTSDNRGGESRLVLVPVEWKPERAAKLLSILESLYAREQSASSPDVQQGVEPERSSRRKSRLAGRSDRGVA